MSKAGGSKFEKISYIARQKFLRMSSTVNAMPSTTINALLNSSFSLLINITFTNIPKLIYIFLNSFSCSYNQSQDQFISEELSLHPLRLEDGSPESPLTETLYLSPHEEKEVVSFSDEFLNSNYPAAGRNFFFLFSIFFQRNNLCI